MPFVRKVGSPASRAVLLHRTHTRAGEVLTYRSRNQLYRVEIGGTGKNRYAVIRPLKAHASTSLSNPGFTSVAIAAGQELARLARTGGGAIGRMISSKAIPTTLVVLALGLFVVGFLSRRLAYAMA